MTGNGWFFIGALTGIVVTVVFEVLVGFLFDLPSRGIDEDALPASEVVERHTGAVRLHAVREFPCEECVPGAGLPGEVVDLRDRQPVEPLDAGHAALGHALGVGLVLVVFLAAMAFAGAVETGWAA